MAVIQADISTNRVPEAFVEALDRHLAGSLDTAGVATVLARSLGRNVEAGLAVQVFLDEARRRDQLPADLIAALMPVVDAVVTEDIPTHGTATHTEADLNPGDTVTAMAPVDPDLGPGSILKERFELLECLGSGAMGQVYRARDRRRTESAAGTDLVALKLVTTNLPGATRALEALRREAAAGQQLTHPSVIRIHDLDRDGPHAFMVMEWLEGESLARLLDRRRGRPMPRVQALQVLEAVCRALGHAHGLGLVHGDIKPGNIFVTEDSGPRLLDFGVSRHVQDSGQALGHTPEYASCEILEGQDPDPRDDLYAVACVAYRMLAGRRPFGGQTALQAEAAGQAPAPVDILPPNQWRVLEKALSFRREQRQPDVITFLAQFKGPRDEQLHALAASDGAIPAAEAVPASAAATADATADAEAPPVTPPGPGPATAPQAEPASPGRPAWLMPAGVAAALLAVLGIWVVAGGPDDTAPAATPVASTPAVTPAVARQTLPALEDTPMPAIAPPEVAALPDTGDPTGPRLLGPDTAGSPPGAGSSAPVTVTQATVTPATVNQATVTQATVTPTATSQPARPAPSSPPPAAAPGTDPSPRVSAAPTAMLAAASPADVLAADRSSRAGTGPALPATPANASPANPTPASPSPASPARQPAPVAALPSNAQASGAMAATTAPNLTARADSPRPGPAAPSGAGGSGPDTRGDPDGDVPAGEVRMANLEMKRYVEPAYPRNAAQRRVSGWVDVGFALDGRGRPADLRILAAEPAGVFEEAALVAVERWRFEEPDGRDLKPGTRTRVRVRFQPD